MKVDLEILIQSALGELDDDKERKLKEHLENNPVDKYALDSMINFLSENSKEQFGEYINDIRFHQKNSFRRLKKAGLLFTVLSILDELFFLPHQLSGAFLF